MLAIPIIANRDFSDNSRSRVNVRAFQALLQDRRETPMANHHRGKPTDGRGLIWAFSKIIVRSATLR